MFHELGLSPQRLELRHFRGGSKTIRCARHVIIERATPYPNMLGELHTPPSNTRYITVLQIDPYAVWSQMVVDVFIDRMVDAMVQVHPLVDICRTTRRYLAVKILCVDDPWNGCVDWNDRDSVAVWLDWADDNGAPPWWRDVISGEARLPRGQQVAAGVPSSDADSQKNS